MEHSMFETLSEINKRPQPFEFYTAADLWTDEHTSRRMLEYHLDGSVDISSRKTDFIDKSVEWITSHFNLSPDSALIDFGCGPGLYTARFARKRIGTTGIDFSKRSIEYARQIAIDEKLDIEYINMNYLDYESDTKYDLITMIMCDYCALSPKQRGIALDKFRKLLRPAGSILLDVYSLNSYNKVEESAVYEFNQMSNFWSPDDYYSFRNVFKYDDVKVILDKYTIIEKSRTRVVYNWLQYFSDESLRKELEENGFRIDESFSDVSGSVFDNESSEFAIVAKMK
jgi:2-polyprenyl-3-methyl-5-hydroxy-6-metoxy-1,4-benzoquinol methylase